PPTGMTATVVSGTRVDLSWTDNATDEYTYVVERSTDGGTTWDSPVSVGASRTSYSVIGLLQNTAYKFRVRAQHPNSTYSAYATSASVTTDPVTAPTGLAT